MEDSNKTSKMFLIVALGLGILATVLAFTFMNQSATPENLKPISIVVAKRDLSPSLPLNPTSDLEVEEIPAKYAKLADRCLSKSSLPSYKGQKVNRYIPAKMPVYLSDLGSAGELVVKEGYRALSIRAAAGLAATGDHVKILVKGSNDSEIIGADDGFKVLAIGITINTNRNMVTKVEQDTASNPARLVTLEVTDAQALDIAKKLQLNPENNMLLVTPPKEKATDAAPK